MLFCVCFFCSGRGRLRGWCGDGSSDVGGAGRGGGGGGAEGGERDRQDHRICCQCNCEYGRLSVTTVRNGVKIFEPIVI